MRCSFCGVVIRRGTGKMFVKNTGEIIYWCSSKCEKNYFLKREPRKRKWSRK